MGDNTVNVLVFDNPCSLTYCQVFLRICVGEFHTVRTLNCVTQKRKTCIPISKQTAVDETQVGNSLECIR